MDQSDITSSLASLHAKVDELRDLVLAGGMAKALDTLEAHALVPASTPLALDHQIQQAESTDELSRLYRENKGTLWNDSHTKMAAERKATLLREDK